MSKPFGQRVRAWRERAGLKQQEVAARASLSPQRLCRIEKGSRSATADEAQVIALALGLTIAQLFDGPPAEEAPNGEAA
jgi:transcriptional regulator with XRE-family HTH domain